MTEGTIPKHLYNGFIYLWINLINDKRYVGSHWGYEDDGYIGSGTVFKKAVKKYGINNFKRVILEFKIYKDLNDLRESEVEFLKRLNVTSKEKYYNLTDNMGCSRRSEKSKTKQKNTITGRKQSIQTIEKRVSKMKGESHPQFKGWYITPHGKFCSSIEASKYCNVSYRTVLYKCSKNKDGWFFKPKEFLNE